MPPAPSSPRISYSLRAPPKFMLALCVMLAESGSLGGMPEGVPEKGGGVLTAGTAGAPEPWPEPGEAAPWEALAERHEALLRPARMDRGRWAFPASSFLKL